MNNSKSFIELKAVWKDDHMFELSITATNGYFLGTTQVYNTTEALSRFAESLFRFPKDKDEHPIVYEAGIKNGYAYFSMKFYCIDPAGHIGVQLNMESNDLKQISKAKDTVTLEILVEPNAIDNFQRELMHLAKNQEGAAILIGVHN
ncbi:MAG TPA: hypothetical protein VNY36_07760 [Bacteroidia bacterium]|jgi:hypothetical protein|nr:hypothetical protein [Bacteroidia bacterium]